MAEEFFMDGGDWTDGDELTVAVVDPPRAAAQQPVKQPDVRPMQGKSRGPQPLYFDLETIPDYSRLDSFGLEPLPPVPQEDPIDKMPDAAKIVAGTVDEVKKALDKLNCPPGAWLDVVLLAELQKDKPRAGVSEAVDKARGKRQAVVQLHDDRRKLLATTPEFCSIAAMGWAIGNSEPNSAVVGQPFPGKADGLVTEQAILDQFWSLVREYSPLIGFNILGFDLPVIFVRSAILGIPSSKMLDLKPWGRDCLDVYAVRFPKGGGEGKPRKLKALAPLYGIEVPAGDCEGSQVEELMKTDPVKVGEYVRSDVHITRAFHKSLCGYFWS